MFEAPSPSVQSSAPAITLATLRDVLAKGQAAHPDLADRMERAALIVALRSIQPAVSGLIGGYWVEASDGSKEYWVVLDERGYRGDTCTCPDYLKRGGPCKHAIAARLLERCLQREGGEGPKPPAPLAFPTRTLRDDEPIPYALTPLAVAALDGARASRCPRCTGTQTAHNAACPLAGDDESAPVAA